MAGRAKKTEFQQMSRDGASLERIRKILGPKCACYVLITCTEPSEKGNMEVELHFEGDEKLAAFLVENASQVFDEQISHQMP